MRLGYIDYLNCYPLYYHMFEINLVSDVQLFPMYPTDLNRMMAQGELDVSPISAAAYADLDKDAALLSDFCLSSIGYVHSVVLISKVPIEELHGKIVGLSSASRTSVVLLKILMRKYYQIEPVYTQTKPTPSLEGREIDAALVIGNEAMVHLAEPAPYTYDLGDLWLRKTGYPVVFAVFAVGGATLEKYPSQLGAVINSYHQSLACLVQDRDSLVRKAGKRYPTIKYDIDRYFRLLKYTFTPELKAALKFYLTLAGELDLIPRVETIRFLDRGETL